MTAADKLIADLGHPWSSRHRLTDRMLAVLLAISRGEVDDDGRWLGRDLRQSVRSLDALRMRGLADQSHGQWLLTVTGRRIVDQIGGDK